MKITADTVIAAGRPGLLLCYDEAHVVRDSPRARQYPLGTLLAAIARAQRDQIPVMLVLSGLPSLTENLARAKSYSERMFQAEELERLQTPEDLNAFNRPLIAGGRASDPAVAESVARDTSGYPFFIQFIGAQLWEASPGRLPSTSRTINDGEGPCSRRSIGHSSTRAWLGRPRSSGGCSLPSREKEKPPS